MMERLAIVVPCYNEEEVLGMSSEALRGVLNDLVSKGKISPDSFVLFVNDGSADKTWSLIEEEHSRYPGQVFGVKLARNVGHQYALTAGLITAADMCDVSVSIDADLQDDVAVIEEMIDVHPGSTLFVKYDTSAYMRARKERKTLTNPAVSIRSMGLVENDEIPSNARASIFLRGYLDTPAALSFLS